MTVDATDTFFVFHSEQLPVTFVSLPVMTTMTMMSDFGSNKTLDRDRNSFSTLLTFRFVATRARFGSVRTETPEAKLWLHEKTRFSQDPRGVEEMVELWLEILFENGKNTKHNRHQISPTL